MLSPAEVQSRYEILQACGFNMDDPTVAKTVNQEYEKLPISVTNRVNSFIDDDLRKASFIALNFKNTNFSIVDNYDQTAVLR